MRQRLAGAIKQQRVGLASALTVAIVLIGVVHAPIVPVVAGCLLPLAYLIFRSWSKSSSEKTRGR